MALLKFNRIGEPSHRIPERADRKLYHHLTLFGRILMDEHTVALLPDLNANTHVVALGAIDPSSSKFGLEKDIAGVEIAQSHSPGMVTFRKCHSASVIEIKSNSLWSFLGRKFWWCWIGTLDRRPRDGPDGGARWFRR